MLNVNKRRRLDKKIVIFCYESVCVVDTFSATFI